MADLKSNIMILIEVINEIFSIKNQKQPKPWIMFQAIYF